jgi:hypothetical protein
LMGDLASHSRFSKGRQTFYAITAQNLATKVVLGKAPNPVYNLASEMSDFRAR